MGEAGRAEMGDGEEDEGEGPPRACCRICGRELRQAGLRVALSRGSRA